MVVRVFSVNLKAGEGPAFARTVDRDIDPILRRFAGFRDHIALVSRDGKQGLGISFWDRQEDADAYARSAYEEVLAHFQKHIEGTPAVTTYDVTNSTIQSITALNATA